MGIARSWHRAPKLPGISRVDSFWWESQLGLVTRTELGLRIQKHLGWRKPIPTLRILWTSWYRPLFILECIRAHGYSLSSVWLARLSRSPEPLIWSQVRQKNCQQLQDPLPCNQCLKLIRDWGFNLQLLCQCQALIWAVQLLFTELGKQSVGKSSQFAGQKLIMGSRSKRAICDWDRHVPMGPGFVCLVVGFLLVVFNWEHRLLAHYGSTYIKITDSLDQFTLTTAMWGSRQGFSVSLLEWGISSFYFGHSDILSPKPCTDFET